MSSGPPPATSPFVRGTTDTKVHFVQAGIRRLVPDTATIAFMAAGQPVRTLTDAELAAIPLGAPLPSRANGTLVSSKAVTPQPIVCFMSRGQRRLIPDRQTLAVLLNGGATVNHLEDADLAAIPLGVPLPTRIDATLYRGGGSIYAYILENGKKRAIPDATTVRDSGHDATALLPIDPADLTDIPDGPPFTSTSRFLHPPPAAVPLVLLPVRIETRFQGSELWVRVYPDNVHINSFEPELTADESSARAQYLAQAKINAQSAKVAFSALAQKYGGARAAWIASAKARPGAKRTQWTRPPFTNLLPERWIVIGYQGNESGRVLGIGTPIADTLAVGPSPDGPGPAADDGMRWTSDFDRAIAAGMALRIPLSGSQTRGFKRLIVVGLRSDLTPADAVARLSGLLEAHHYTDGLELLPHGAPTNNTSDVKSGFNSHDPNYADLFALEQGPARSPARPTADGDRLERALGLAPALLAHVRGADSKQDEEARAMNTVLWPTTWGYFLDQLVTGAVPQPDEILPAARAHFIDHVRARGHFPILRIGRQPYGVLPVTWSAAWTPLTDRPLDARLAGLLGNLRGTWESSVPNVPRIPGAADAEAALVSVLGMSPSSTSYMARNVIGPEYNLTFWKFIRQNIGLAWWNALAAKSVADAGEFASVMAATRLSHATFDSGQRLLSDLIVAPTSLDGLAAPDYVKQLPSLGWQDLRNYSFPSPPVPLLLLMLRHAALRQYVDTAMELLPPANAAQPVERLEPELVGLSAQVRPTPWDILGRTLPGKGPVGAYLDGTKDSADLPAFAAFWKSLGALSGYSAEALDFAVREVLDLGAYRLDAWITSLAHLRLDDVRAAAPQGGIVLGGYGWVEDVGPQPQAATSAGYIHAPSLAHATTAAVLRSGYLSHRNDATQPMAIGLSSDRVRLGLHLLDGVRTGQSLGDLLGYRLERALHESGLDQYIDDLRAASHAGGADTSTDVIEGLALVRSFHADIQKFWSAPGLPSDQATRDRIATAIGRIDDALDAVADLTLSESVHQLVRGNMVRAGATLDAIARGDSPPPDLDVIETPRAGTALTQRLLAIAISGPALHWSGTPRALAEPRLNSMAAALLPDPARVHARAIFVDASGAAIGHVEFPLNRLALAPLDLLEMPDTGGLTGELADRLRRAAAALRPTAVPASAAVQIVAERDPNWTTDIISVGELLGLVEAVRRFTGGARALEPRDLVVPGDAPGAIDTTELQARADAAENQIRSVRTALSGSGPLDKALLAAASFGVIGAVPSLDAAAWPKQAAAATAELANRIASLDRLASAFVRSSAAPDALRDHDLARLKAIFGDALVALPALAPALSATWPRLWANSAVLQAGDVLALDRWFTQASRVRAGAARLETALLYAEALAGDTLAHFDVAQLPFTAGDRWLALELNGKAPSSRLSLLAFSPVQWTTGATVAGLVIDDWVEVLPSSEQITGIAFHHDEPAARAPQTILLAVRPDNFPEWTIESLEGSVLEALDLAKLRAVDPDALGGLGQYLPALYFAYNAGGPHVDTVSTDFNLSLRTAQIRND